MLRSYLETAASENQKVVYIFNSDLTFRDVLREIYLALETPTYTENQHELVQGLHKILIDEYSKGGNVVLIVDEAQNMPVTTLESLRMLSNLETPKDKLIQLVLIGQPELEEKLDLHELRQLKQRIAMRTKILPLSAEESRSYVEHRLARAGALIESIFNPRAVRELVKRSEGIPRLINILADSALITGFGYQQSPISPSVIKEVSNDVRGLKKAEVPSSFRWILVPLALVLLGLTLWIGNVQNVQEVIKPLLTTTASIKPPDNSEILRKERELRRLEQEAERRRLELEKKAEELRLAQLAQEQDLQARSKKQQDTEAAWVLEESKRKAELARLQKQYDQLKKQAREAAQAANKQPKVSNVSGTEVKEQKKEPLKSVAVTTQGPSSGDAQAPKEVRPETIQSYTQKAKQNPVAPTQDREQSSNIAEQQEVAEPAPEPGPEQMAWVVPNNPALENEQETTAVEVPAKIIQYVPPSYPYTALMQGVQGIVTVEVQVTEDGHAAEINVVDGIEGLNSAAIAAVRKWRFSPGTRNGIPTSTWMTYRIAFRLRG